MTRIVSLLPATTEVVAALGHGDQLVGRSHECDHPSGVERLPVVSRPRREPVGTSADIHRGVVELLREVLSIYELDEQALVEARPDLILTQDLCRVCAVDESAVADAVRDHLQRPVEIVACSPLTLDEMLDDVDRIAAAIGDAGAGVALRDRLNRGFEEVAAAVAVTPRPRVAVLEWVDPLMGCGNWAPELIELAGGQPVLATPGGHTPLLPAEALQDADPDVIIVAPCGYDLPRGLAERTALEALPGWGRLRAVQGGRVAVLDGSAYLNRPGPRLVDTAVHLQAIITGAAPSPGAWAWLQTAD